MTSVCYPNFLAFLEFHLPMFKNVHSDVIGTAEFRTKIPVIEYCVVITAANLLFVAGVIP